MSKIGKKPIKIPEKTKIEVKDEKIIVEGPKGKLERILPPEIIIEQKDNIIAVIFKGSKEKKALWGTLQSIIQNMVDGVNKEFEKELKIEGVGWRATIEGKVLVLKVGFSHLVKIPSIVGVNFTVEKDIIKISGIDKEKVGLMASKIRLVKPPEPYKGKGIRYIDEIVKKKAGKKAIGSEK